MTEPTPRFPSEQAEAQHWLTILKDGPESQKLPARLGLARIFERSGMPDEAIELLVTCIQAGHRDPDTYEALGRLYAAQNRQDLSVRARAEAQHLRAQAERERTAAEAREEEAEEAATAQPDAVRPNRRVGAYYMAAGTMMSIGGFLFATSFQANGLNLLLYALPVAGVVIFLRGLVTMLPHN